jgi:phosphate-selective porin OprO/OprP
VITALLAGVADATSAPPPDGEAQESSDGSLDDRITQVFDRVWGFATPYEDFDNPVLKRFSLRGRFQVDFPLFEAKQGDYSDPQIRRLRLGFESLWLADLTLHVEVDLDFTCDKGEVCDDDAYEGLTDAYLGWAPLDAFELRVGKISAPFTLDGATSSRRLMTLERNNVSNNLWFPAEYHAGLDVAGEIGSWRYLAGVYSSSTTEEFGDFDGGVFMLLTLEHDFSDCLGVPEALLTFNYVYNEADKDNVSTRDLSHVFSLHGRIDTGSWGLRGDLSGGLGYAGQSDLIGLVLMPFYHLTEKLEFVGRYTFLHSFASNGVRFSRYENRIEPGRGDRYNEFYAGLNWLVYGHRFKLQTGVKYTMMDDAANDGGRYRGWGWTTGLRISW